MSTNISQATSAPRVTHLLKRFGQSVTLCPTVPQKRPPLVTNSVGLVTCKRCKELWRRGAA